MPIERVLLLEAPQVWQTKDHTPPLSLGYLASAARQALPAAAVHILDATAEGWSVEQTLAAICARQPDVLGVTGNSHNRFSVIDLCDGVKRVCPRTRLVLGGPHFSYTAEDALRNVPAVDFIVRGEGERTFAELLGALNEDSSAAGEGIAGLSFRHGGEVVHNPDREPMADIDLVPAWELFRHELYQARLEGTDQGRAVGVVSSRGCPFRCVFCANRNQYSRRVRFRRPAHFVAELELLADRYGYRDFDFWDDTFTLSREHAGAICREMLRRQLKLRWYALIRADTTDRSLLELMREAGCRSVGLGVESGSPTVLQSIRKEIQISEVRRVVRQAVRLRLRVKTFFLHSLPGETLYEIGRTRELMYDLRSYSRRVRTTWGLTAIYPGTELELMAREQGQLPAEFSWNRREFSGLKLDTENGCVPYYEGGQVSLDRIRQFVRECQPSLSRRLARPVKRVLMGLPFGHRLVP